MVEDGHVSTPPGRRPLRPTATLPATLRPCTLQHSLSGYKVRACTLTPSLPCVPGILRRIAGHAYGHVRCLFAAQRERERARARARERELL
jgi:hypothetical protein